MVTTKVKKVLPPISEWSVTNHGVKLYINLSYPGAFKNGISLDVEDDEQGNFVGLGIFVPEENACYYWSDFNLAKELTIPKFTAHNGRTDVAKLQKWGFKVDESFLNWDTQLIEHIWDSSQKRFGLKALVKKYFEAEYPDYETIVGKKKAKIRVTLDKQPLDLVSEYNACDTYWTHKLAERQGGSVGDREIQYFEEVEKPVSFIFGRMEQRGIRIDLPYLNELKTSLEKQQAEIEAQIKNELGNINLGSYKQLLEALHKKGINPTLKRKPSTDKNALAHYSYIPIVRDLLKYSELSTLLEHFVYPYLERNQEIVHPQYMQCGTRTGRPSCKDPNLLQIPRKTDNGKLVRRMFIPRQGYSFGDCDFGQIEPRILAHLSKDKTMCQMFNEGTDFHNFTSTRLQIDREKAKVLNLSVGYRATFKSVSNQLKCNEYEAQAEIDKWWAMFPELWDWQQQLIYDSKRTGYCTTLCGRRIKVEDLNHGNQWRRETAERQLINNVIQGSAQEVMKHSMIKADKAGINLLIQVYDELLVEEKEEEIEQAVSVLVDCMENSLKLEVPLVVEAKIGSNWSQCH